MILVRMNLLIKMIINCSNWLIKELLLRKKMKKINNNMDLMTIIFKSISIKIKEK